MHMSSQWIPAVLLLLNAPQVGAQERPALPERMDTLIVRYAETVIGRGIMQWSHPQAAHLQVYIWTSALDGSSVTDSLLSDPRTLRPRREVRVAGDTTHIVEFGDRAATVRTFVNGALAVESRVDEAGLFSSASIEALAASMPFTAGASAEFLTYHAPPSRVGAQRTRITVVAREDVDGRPAWRVTASTPGGGSTYWVDAASRTVLQMDTREGEALITFRR